MRKTLFLALCAVLLAPDLVCASGYDLYGTRGLVKGNLQIGTSTPTISLGNGDVFVSGDLAIGGDMTVTGATVLGSSTGVADWTGLQPVLALANVATTYSATNATVNSYTLTVAQDAFDAGEAIAIDFSGNITGGNANTSVLVAMGGSDVYTLSFGTATGEFSGRIIITQEAAAAQRISGWATTEDDGYHQAEYGTATTDFSAGGVAVQLRCKSENAGDTIYLYTSNWLLQP